MSVWSIICAILVLALCILIHEAGHFASALALGIPVEEFSIGFGPKLVQFKFRGVKYSIRLILLGGYVRYFMEAEEGDAGARKVNFDEAVEGDENAPQTDDKAKKSGRQMVAELTDCAYFKQPAWRRLISVFCGPFMNFVLAFVVGVMLYTFLGNPFYVPRVSSYTVDSPADEAGLNAGDVFVSVGGTDITYGEAGIGQVSQAIAASDGAPLDVTVRRGDEQLNLKLTPEYSQTDGRYMIGINFGTDSTPCSVGEALGRSVEYNIRVAREMFTSLGGLFKSDVPINEQLTGPVGTVQIISEQVQRGGMDALNIILLISLNFGILNLMPIPGLDGSKIVFLIVEMIRRKPIPPMKEAVVNMIGLALLMGLMLFVTYGDIARLIAG